MRELIRTSDLALVSAIEAVLSDAGISYRIFDRDVSVMEGSIGIFPIRVVVPNEHATAAVVLLTDARLLPEEG